MDAPPIRAAKTVSSSFPLLAAEMASSIIRIEFINVFLNSTRLIWSVCLKGYPFSRSEAIQTYSELQTTSMIVFEVRLEKKLILYTFLCFFLIITHVRPWTHPSALSSKWLENRHMTTYDVIWHFSRQTWKRKNTHQGVPPSRIIW